MIELSVKEVLKDSNVYIDVDQNTHYEDDQELFLDYARFYVDDEYTGSVVDENLPLMLLYRVAKSMGYGRVNVAYQGVFVIGDDGQ